MHLGWGHQASLETIKIKEQPIFELYPEDSVCNVCIYLQGDTMMSLRSTSIPLCCMRRKVCLHSSPCSDSLHNYNNIVRNGIETRYSRESLQLVVNGDLVQVAPVVPHLKPAKPFSSTLDSMNYED